jgi:small-conductance mechanosensitive channel
MNEKLNDLLGFEPFVLLSLLSLLSFVIYQLFMRKVNASRHQTMKRLLKELLASYVAFIFFWVSQFLISKNPSVLDSFSHYIGLTTVIFGAILFIRTIKIMVFEYLFLKSMNVGVPVLLVNLVTLILSVFIAAWLSTSVFGVRWAPLLATSAIVSVVLGLALQETLGNLFAGVALQFDKPYEIGDWIEIHAEKTSFVGEVYEITWRATILYGFFDEVITVPNRLIAQSEVSNFSARKKPIYRGLSLFLDVNADENQVKEILVKVLKQVPGILQELSHSVLLRDLGEKGAHWRLFYPISHYGKQYVIVDEILMQAQGEFKKSGIQVSRIRIDAESGSAKNREKRA